MNQNMFEVLLKNSQAILRPKRVKRKQNWGASAPNSWHKNEVEGKGFDFVASTHEADEKKRIQKLDQFNMKEEKTILTILPLHGL